MNAIFVDTGIWYGFIDADDANHAAAKRVIGSTSIPLVTSWPVVWETISLVSRRLGGRSGARLGHDLIAEKWAHLIELSSADYALAFDLMSRHDHLKLSAVDATACAMVRRLNIPTVASFDEHFRIVLPERTVLGRNT